jgi:hypothetical protein
LVASCSRKERRKQKADMLPSILIRLGGVAAMVSGALYVSAELLNLPGGGALWRSYYGFLPGGGSLFFNALLVGAMAATLAIAALYALRRDISGVLGTLSSVAAFVGVALTLWGELGSPVAAVLGLWVESVGVLALGLVTMAVGELAWWCGVALIVWGWALVFLLLLPMMGVLAPPFPVSWGGVLAGVIWIVVGFGVFRAARGRTEQPQRER